MSRLSLLCFLNNQSGGTIHQMNDKYKVDVLSLSEQEFNFLIAKILETKGK